MEKTVKERIVEYLEYKGIGQNRFEAMAGIPNGTISHAKKSPSVDNLMKIANASPDLNWEWLLTGKGDMIINQGNEISGNVVHNGMNNDIKQQSVSVGSDVSVLLEVISCLKQQLAEKDQQINQLISKI